ILTVHAPSARRRMRRRLVAACGHGSPELAGALDGRAGAARLGVDVAQLVVDPLAGVAALDHALEAVRAPAALLVGHRERAVDRVRLLLDVERVDRKRELAELLVRARVLGQQTDALALVDERAL